MSDEHQKARELVARNVRIWPTWREDGGITLILNLVGPNGEPSSTVGMCDSKDTETLSHLLRGLECGYVIARKTNPPLAGD